MINQDESYRSAWGRIQQQKETKSEEKVNLVKALNTKLAHDIRTKSQFPPKFWEYARGRTDTAITGSFPLAVALQTNDFNDIDLFVQVEKSSEIPDRICLIERLLGLPETRTDHHEIYKFDQTQKRYESVKHELPSGLIVNIVLMRTMYSTIKSFIVHTFDINCCTIVTDGETCSHVPSAAIWKRTALYDTRASESRLKKYKQRGWTL